MRQIYPPSPPPPPVTPMPQIKLPIETRPGLPNSMGMTVAVRGLRITGSTAFSENQLMPLVADAMGNALNIQELDAMAGRWHGRGQRDHATISACRSRASQTCSP